MPWIGGWVPRLCVLGHPRCHQAEPALRPPGMWNMFILYQRPNAAKTPEPRRAVVVDYGAAAEP